LAKPATNEGHANKLLKLDSQDTDRRKKGRIRLPERVPAKSSERSPSRAEKKKISTRIEKKKWPLKRKGPPSPTKPPPPKGGFRDPKKG